MNKPALRILGLLILLACPVPLARADGEERALEQAKRLIDRGRHADAAERLRNLVDATPGIGEAWVLLASAYHGLGNYPDAIEANERAADFPQWRGMALYNRGCAEALSGKGDAAFASVEAAVAAGFLDFDLMARDPDLASIRSRLDLPAAKDFQVLRGRNGVEIPYLVQLPADFDPKTPTPALVSFGPGSYGPLAVSWFLDHFWGAAARERGWILIHPVAPERGWFNHPSHHALEDLLRELRERYAVEGRRFHLFGWGSGARVALTYAGMSGRYFQSLNVASAGAWSRWSDRDIRGFADLPVRQFVGSEDAFALAQAKRVAELLEPRGGFHELSVRPGNGPMLEDLRGVELLEILAPPEPDPK